MCFISTPPKIKSSIEEKHDRNENLQDTENKNDKYSLKNVHIFHLTIFEMFFVQTLSPLYSICLSYENLSVCCNT